MRRKDKGKGKREIRKKMKFGQIKEELERKRKDRRKVKGKGEIKGNGWKTEKVEESKERQNQGVKKGRKEMR